MIDRRFQGMGSGRRAIDPVIDDVRTRPVSTGLATSCVPVFGGPGPNYHAWGFVDTGEEDEGQLMTFLDV